MRPVIAIGLISDFVGIALSFSLFRHTDLDLNNFGCGVFWLNTFLSWLYAILKPRLFFIRSRGTKSYPKAFLVLTEDAKMRN